MGLLKRLIGWFKASVATHALVYVMLGGLSLIIAIIGSLFRLDVTIVGALMGTGLALIATGSAEYFRYLSSTTTLEIEPDLEVFKRVTTTCRLSLLVRNTGSVIVRDAKAVIDVLEPGPKELRGLIRGGLVNEYNPRIRGELLPWAVPEKPIQRPASVSGKPVYTDYTHITSISPHQTAKLLLLDFRQEGDNAIVLNIFSEYGAPGPQDPAPRPLRAILRLPLDKQVKLKLRVTVAGEGLRRPYTVELTLTPQLLRKIIECVEEGRVDEAIGMLAGVFKLV